MHGFGRALDSGNMDSAVGEIDRIPTQSNHFGCPQAMPVGDQDHRGVAMAVAILAGSLWNHPWARPYRVPCLEPASLPTEQPRFQMQLIHLRCLARLAPDVALPLVFRPF